jgi:hypothetical protein
MKQAAIIITSLFIFQSQLFAVWISFSDGLETTHGVRSLELADKSHASDNEATASNLESNDIPIIIHYGLNDSHSRSWVQQNQDGIIGITYFQRFAGSYDEGTLIYKTIQPDGSGHTDSVTAGQRLEKSVLLYDSLSHPHIFVARSNDFDQVIDHYYENDSHQWQSEIIIHFNNEGGKFIYELSADTGPEQSFHLLILKTRSDIDSDDFMDAYINSYLYHLTNSSGAWVKELVHNYDMAYTYDMYIKSSSRQDIKVDTDGYVHVVFGEQVNGNSHSNPSRLQYSTNKTGSWVVEIALNADLGSVDDAEKSGSGDWSSEIITESDDGYYGGDGRNYTGGLSHLVFDDSNTPHVVFSDIASTHWPGTQRLHVGNIRYGVYEDGAWNITTVYRQPRPTGWLDATEMYGLCLIVSPATNTIRAIGQELVVTGEYQYTSTLLDFAWSKKSTNIIGDPGDPLPDRPHLSQNYPNPFNPGTSIKFDLPRNSQVTITVYNLLLQQVNVLVNDELKAGENTIYWDGTDSRGRKVAAGIYFYRLQTADYIDVKKMLHIK